ncbi:methyltransferase [Fusarium bulbicola]|nr:methyltransferase [Fusarium bulbicola]
MAEPDNPAVTNILEPEDQTAEDSGVDEAIDDASSTQSISSSIFQYRVENGRTYATYGSGGTGIWAMDVADEHPEAEVLGVDLSPIQPSMYALLWNTDSLITERHESRVPPNCRFEIDDLEDDWTFKHQFDFIFIRSMIASFKSWPDIFSKAFESLEPGGYIEVQDNVYPLASDDDTIHNTDILMWTEFMVNAADKIGRSITVASKFKPMLADAGFIDIREIKKKIPMNRWPKDPRYKALGTWSSHMLRSGLEGISMGLLTKLGLTGDEVHVLLAEVRRDLLNTKIHGYWDTYDRPLPRQTIGVD